MNHGEYVKDPILYGELERDYPWWKFWDYRRKVKVRCNYTDCNWFIYYYYPFPEQEGVLKFFITVKEHVISHIKVDE